MSIDKQLVPAKPVLDSIVFQIIYGAGYTYLDRCGQCLVDIERARPDWIPGEVSVHSGNMANDGLNMTAAFSFDRFNFTAVRAPDVDAMAIEAQALWGIIQENLNLSEYVRVGCRFQWLLASETPAAAEAALSRAAFTVRVPDEWKLGFAQVSRSMVTVLKRDSVEYRVALQSGVRTDAVHPSTLATVVDPRMLPKGRREAHLAAISRRRTYNADPRHVVNLDVDCVSFGPDVVKPRDFISRQAAVVRSSFVSILEGL